MDAPVNERRVAAAPRLHGIHRRGLAAGTLVLFALLLCGWQVMQAQASLFPKAGTTICGRILDDGSQPLHGVRINAVLSSDDSSWIAPVWSDNEGKFCLKDIKPGAYELTVSHPGYASEELSVSLWGDKSEVPDTTLVRSVGELTDISRVVTRGNTAFTEKAIRSGLLGDNAIVLSSHPMAPRGAYVSTIQRKVLEGYRTGGFPNATVTAHVSSDNSQILVDISEGKRYTNGDISISGLHTLKPQVIKKQLREERFQTTSVQTPSISDKQKGMDELLNLGREHSGVAAWPPGETSNFSDDARQTIENYLKYIFAESGYWSPSFTLRVVPDPGKTTASLTITVTDEGRPEVIREIRVSGNTRNPEAELLRYLNIHVGVTATSALLEQIDQRLESSARFIRHDVKTEKIAEEPPGLRLAIDVTESKYAPSLTRPLSPEQEAAVKACGWLRGALSRGDDITFEVQDTNKPLDYFQAIASSEGILVATLGSNSDGKRSLRSAGLLATKSGLFSITGRGGLQGDPIGADTAIIGGVAFRANLDDAEEHFTIGLTGGARARRSSPKPYNFQIDAPPVACIVWLGSPDRKSRLENGLLTSDSEEGHVVIVASTGEIRESRASSKEDHYDFRMSFQKGAFASTRDQLLSLPGIETSRPMSVWIGFLAELLLDDDFSSLLFERLDTKRRHQTATAANSLIAAALSAFDPFVHSLASDNPFDIPPDEVTDKEAAPSQLASMLAAFIFGHVNEWFAVNSWPWTVFHEAVYVLGNKTQYTGLEMERIYSSDEIGPVGFLFCAEALKRQGSSAAKDFAAQGLKKLSKEDLRKDLQVLFAGNGLLSQSADRFVVSLRQLPEADIDALVALLSPELQPVMRKVVARAKASPNVAGALILTAVFEEDWDESLRPMVEKRLNAIAAPSGESKVASLSFSEPGAGAAGSHPGSGRR